MTPPQIFDRAARRNRRARMSSDSFLLNAMADDLIDRLESVTRSFRSALLQGGSAKLIEALEARGIACTVADVAPAPGVTQIAEEDTRQFEDASFDLILSCGVLDTVSDLPGALVLLRRALVPDGLLLAAFASAPSLSTLRAVAAEADTAVGISAARFHPQIDVRAAGDLLVRAGFALPVADLETHEVSYRSLGRLLMDLRDAGATNVLTERHPVTSAWLAEANEAFARRATAEGTTAETFSHVTLTGWAPGPDQPRPALPGSGRTSLSAILDRSR